MNDIITHVNNVCVIDVPHSAAVEALKKAGNSVHLTVKRKRQMNGSHNDFIEVLMYASVSAPTPPSAPAGGTDEG